MRSSDARLCPYCNAPLHDDIAAATQPKERGHPQKLARPGHWNSISQAPGWALTLLVVTCVAGSAIVTRWWSTRSVPAWNAQVVVESIVPVAKMATAEATVQETLSYTDAVWGSIRIPKLLGRKFWGSERAKLAIGFNLIHWDAAQGVRVDQQTRMVTVTVPKPELLYVTADATSLIVIGETGLFRDGNLTKEETAQLLQRVDEGFRKSERVGELDRQARIQFENILTQALKPYGFRLTLIYQ
jgi:hypothetical protein